jgi:hypothetical protein
MSETGWKSPSQIAWAFYDIITLLFVFGLQSSCEVQINTKPMELIVWGGWSAWQGNVRVCLIITVTCESSLSMVFTWVKFHSLTHSLTPLTGCSFEICSFTLDFGKVLENRGISWRACLTSFRNWILFQSLLKLYRITAWKCSLCLVDCVAQCNDVFELALCVLQ